MSMIITSRSKYQLKNFCIYQHDTPAMRWRQIVMETEVLCYDIAMAELDCRRKNIEIKRLLQSSDDLDLIAAEEKKLGLAMTERKLEAARLELKWLEEIAAEVGEHTAEQIEADQPDYWRLRLQRQAGLEQMSAQQGIGAGNLQSMLNVGLLQKGEQQCAISPGN